MKLLEYCLAVEKCAREIAAAMPGERREAALRMAATMVGERNVMGGSPGKVPEAQDIYQSAVQLGFNGDKVRDNTVEFFVALMAAVEGIWGAGEEADAMHKEILRILHAHEELGVYRKVDGILVTRRLVMKPMQEIVSTVRGRDVPQLRDGGGYLLTGRRDEEAYRIFLHYLSKGYTGLCITRTHPRLVRERYGFEKTPVLWLGQVESGDEIARMDPTNLGMMTNLVRDFIEKSERGIVLLDGVEYLVTQNGFESVLRFVQYLHEHAAARRKILLVPVHPKALGGQEFALLEAELESIRGEE